MERERNAGREIKDGGASSGVLECSVLDRLDAKVPLDLRQALAGVVFRDDRGEEGDQPAYRRGQPHDLRAAEGDDHLVEGEGGHQRDQPSEGDRGGDHRRLQLFRQRVAQQGPRDWPEAEIERGEEQDDPRGRHPRVNVVVLRVGVAQAEKPTCNRRWRANVKSWGKRSVSR